MINNSYYYSKSKPGLLINVSYITNTFVINVYIYIRTIYGNYDGNIQYKV